MLRSFYYGYDGFFKNKLIARQARFKKQDSFSENVDFFTFAWYNEKMKKQDRRASMNQDLMTLDFWQDTVIYEGNTFPVGTLACDALNVPADTVAKMNEQCEKINLLLGMLNAGQDASALFPMTRDAALAMLDILSQTPPFSYMNISQH
ncbi:MAG: hypothetical protein ACLU3I_05155, partial [Acutalibacteraceae bacterium]